MYVLHLFLEWINERLQFATSQPCACIYVNTQITMNTDSVTRKKCRDFSVAPVFIKWWRFSCRQLDHKKLILPWNLSYLSFLWSSCLQENLHHFMSVTRTCNTNTKFIMELQSILATQKHGSYCASMYTDMDSEDLILRVIYTCNKGIPPGKYYSLRPHLHYVTN